MEKAEQKNGFKAEQNWEKPEMEEFSEEEGSSLVHVRKLRNGTEPIISESPPPPAAAADGGGGELGHDGAEVEEKPTEVEEEEAIDGVLDDEPEEEEEAIDGEQEKENLVFFDKAQGVDSTSTDSDSGESQIVENLLDDLVVQNNSTNGINDKHEGNIENIKASNEIESAEAALINDEEDDLEVAEVDVERVIKTQNTHELYCPNCNSCITKRVILRKRKRIIRTSDDEVKRNKAETEVKSDLGKGSVGSRGDNARHTDDVDARIPNVDEDGRERVPDVFRCLSCFSFFIPTGDGFKFKLFGDKTGEEKFQDEQAPPSVKKNWFASVFASKKQETTVGLGSSIQTEVGKSDVHVISSSNLDGQSGQSSFSQNAPSPPPNKQNTLLDENLINSFRDKFDMTKIESADVTMDHFESYTEDMKESISSKEVPVISEDYSYVTALPMSSQVTNGEPSQDTISSFSHQDGLKLLISSNNSSKTLANSKEGRMTTHAMQSDDSDKDVIPLSTPVSELKASNVDGNWNFSVSIPHEQEQDVTATILTESIVENKNMNAGFSSIDPGHIHPTETSEHIITKTKFEVHSGKDTVINIDSQPDMLSPTLEGVTDPTEASSLLQRLTHSNTAGRERIEAREEYGIEVIKSIVYGGLAELITSLSVVSSAAGGGADTLNILALGMANLIGGLFIIFHNLWELKCDRVEDQVNNQISDQVTEQRDRYKKLLGRRKNFILHAVVAIISYLVFGLMPPAVYGFSFRKTEDKQLKLLAVAAASFVCLVALALGRAHVQRCPRPYFTSVATFVILGYMGSGVSYAAGKLIERLLEKLGIFQTSPVSGLAVNGMMASASSGWASY